MELPAELEATIRAAPDDRAGYLVAADWLTSQGDPQGELIALSLAPPTDEVTARIAELQRALEPVDTSGDWNPISIEWRWGFVVGVAMSARRVRDDPGLLRAILRAPVARFLRTLELLDLQSDRLAAALDDDPAALASLRTLIVAADAPDIQVAPVWRHAPALERLVMRVGNQVPIVLPQLRELAILGAHGALTGDADLPRLETLRIQVPVVGPPATGQAGLVRLRLQRPGMAARFPALRRLTIASADLGKPEVWRDIELVRQLELFDLMSVAPGVATQRLFVVDASVPAPAGLVMMTGTRNIPPGTLVPLPERPMLRVGRRGHMDLSLSHGSIAKGHARLHHLDGRWQVRDLISNNGTWVNRHRIDVCPLRSGDELAFGSVEFRFVTGDLDAEADKLRTRFALPST